MPRWPASATLLVGQPVPARPREPLPVLGTLRGAGRYDIVASCIDALVCGVKSIIPLVLIDPAGPGGAATLVYMIRLVGATPLAHPMSRRLKGVVAESLLAGATVLAHSIAMPPFRRPWTESSLPGALPFPRGVLCVLLWGIQNRLISIMWLWGMRTAGFLTTTVSSTQHSALTIMLAVAFSVGIAFAFAHLSISTSFSLALGHTTV